MRTLVADLNPLQLLALATCGRAVDPPQAEDTPKDQPVTMAAAPDSETMFIPFNNNPMLKMQRSPMLGARPMNGAGNVQSMGGQAQQGMMQAFGAPSGDGKPFQAVNKPLRSGGQNMRGLAQPGGDVQPFGAGDQNSAGAQNFGSGMKNFRGGQNLGTGGQNLGAAGMQNFGAGDQPMAGANGPDSDGMASGGNQQPAVMGRRKRLRVKKRRTTVSQLENADLKALLLEKEEVERKATPKYKKALNGRLSDGQ